jgi:hypothetical protein
MAAMRVPLWLKIGWTVWVIAWAPFYWKQYGLQNFLFFCDLPRATRHARPALSALIPHFLFKLRVSGCMIAPTSGFMRLLE